MYCGCRIPLDRRRSHILASEPTKRISTRGPVAHLDGRRHHLLLWLTRPESRTPSRHLPGHLAGRRSHDTGRRKRQLGIELAGLLGRGDRRRNNLRQLGTGNLHAAHLSLYSGGAGRNNLRIHAGGISQLFAPCFWTWRHNRVQQRSDQHVFAADFRSRSDNHVGGTRSAQARPDTFDRRRARHTLIGQKVLNRRARLRQIQAGDIDYFLPQHIAARHPDHLRAMSCRLTACAAGPSRFGAAPVLSLRQLVSGKINHVIFGQESWLIRTQRWRPGWQYDQPHEQDRLDHPGCCDAAIGQSAGPGFPGQGRGRLPQRRPDRGDELRPRVRPLNQKFGCGVHPRFVSAVGPTAISISSPMPVPLERSVSGGSSRTEAARKRTRPNRHGLRL